MCRNHLGIKFGYPSRLGVVRPNAVQALELLKQPPAPGFIRMARVDEGCSYAIWSDLPTPQSDLNKEAFFEWCRKNGHDDVYQWPSSWQCAAGDDQFYKWWPYLYLNEAIQGGAKVRVLEVPIDACVHTGVQYVFDNKRAKYLQ